MKKHNTSKCKVKCALDMNFSTLVEKQKSKKILAEVVDFMENQTKSGPPDLPAGEAKMLLQCLDFG